MRINRGFMGRSWVKSYISEEKKEKFAKLAKLKGLNVSVYLSLLLTEELRKAEAEELLK